MLRRYRDFSFMLWRKKNETITFIVENWDDAIACPAAVSYALVYVIPTKFLKR